MTGRPAEGSRGDWYDSVYERREAAGENVHGEADFIMSWETRLSSRRGLWDRAGGSGAG